MKYYIVLLKNGNVVDICSFDNEEARDKQLVSFFNANPFNAYWDDAQKINIVD